MLKLKQNNFITLLVIVIIMNIGIIDWVISGQVADVVQVKYFFPRDGKQNPQGVIDNLTPNWYYYWTQITGGSDLSYDQSSNIWPGEVFGCYDYNGSEDHKGKCVIFDAVVQKDNNIGFGGKAGIDCFGQTVLHERKHKELFAQMYSDTDGDGIPNYSILYDEDLDFMSDTYEENHGLIYKKDDYDGDGTIEWDCDFINKIFGDDIAISRDTDQDGINDGEEDPIAAEFGWLPNSHQNKDWAHPGQNWP